MLKMGNQPTRRGSFISSKAIALPELVYTELVYTKDLTGNPAKQ